MTQIYSRPFIPPLHERPSLIEHKQGLLISPESQENSQNPICSDPTYEGSDWRGSRLYPPRSEHNEYQHSSVGDMYQNRQEGGQQPPREQLPSLSSLFGAPSSHGSRPVHSPFSDRPSPIFPSPSDSRHSATPIHPDRPYDSSYFQRPPVGRQYSHGSRPDHIERHHIAPPPRPIQAGRPESPRYESGPRLNPNEVGRSQPLPSTSSGWSPHSQSSRLEYFSRDTSSSFRHGEPSHLQRQEADSRQIYRGQAAPSAFPPTPATTVSGEGPTTKDGLGPKIWTGTQFLPRFVRQADVPGEGTCYFYDDGTHCKTVIDGEVVNAHWGVTKAGKPRKRLAIACITCREKKIKCDPDYPRCVQCEKFGRVCKFKNAPRGGQNSPGTPPGEQEDLIPRPTSSSRGDAESYHSEKREHSQNGSPTLMLRTGSPDSDTHSNKRHRTGYTDFTRLTPVASETSPRPSLREAPSPSVPWTDPLIPAPVERSVLVEWQTNPYATQPALVTELIEAFFKYVPETAHCILPEGPFKAWALSHRQKSVDDLMLIYTILALATVFSLKEEHKPLGTQFAAISRYACDSRHFTLQLVQSRLLLSLYYFALNNPNDAWDFCGSALRAASGMKLNLEMEKTDEAYQQDLPYGLNYVGYAESRRRTFWSAYLIDRFNGFCSGHLCIINPEDVFLKLPCDSKFFESQTEVDTPFFDLATPPLSANNKTVGPMAYLINVSTIWGHVMANIYRNSQRPIPLANNIEFVAFYETMTQRLHDWKDSLPPRLTFTPENMARAADAGKIPTFIMLHSVYHTTTIKLNRFIQKSTFSSAQLTHHVSTAKQYARSFLNILDTLAATHSKSTLSTPKKFSSPFVGYSIVAAVDVLSAKFPLSSTKALLASFDGAQVILGELALFWQSGRYQNSMIQKRLRELNELSATLDDPSRASFRHTVGREGADGLFEMTESIEKTFSREHDCFYT